MGRLEQQPPWRDEEDAPQYRAFQQTHRSLADRVERVLMHMVTLGLVALVLVQTLQVIPFIRRQMSLTEAMEGIPYEEVLAWTSDGDDAGSPAVALSAVSSRQEPLSLTVVLVSRRSAPAARLLVDGRVAGTFGSSALTVAVTPGQQVEVDGSQVPEELTFRVVGAPGLSNPALGTSVVTRGNRKSLGLVRAGEAGG